MAWMFTEARKVTCPKCNAGIGEFCKTPKGRKAVTPHTERLMAMPKELVDACRKGI